MFTSKRLSKVFNMSKEITIDDSSKIILISDCHRGDNTWADDFAHNQNLLFTALNYYYKNDYIYVEIGDGDELWENRKFEEIRQTHSNIFDLMSKFYKDNRLYMIWGNHDIVKRKEKYVKKNLYYYYDTRKEQWKPLFDKIQVYEGLILKYLNIKNKIFVVHGHQGDLINDQLWPISRFLVRYIWRPLTLYLGIKDPTSAAKNYKKKKIIERKIIRWAKVSKQIIITGHTHRPRFPSANEVPYFNDGSCVHPRCITGIEIKNGEIMLIKWSVETKDDGTLYVSRGIISGPEKLQAYFQ
ncbi:metallophosphoesterase [Clostridium sp. MB40-C1]|uniref:metallophosphoesterase n=1 Tax=Clostridium sp. MB40-C1 TaxID=3070996 RepID=UPI0027DFD7A8|nr:metallophosphoesterase [Clostridium sp. MB40-C1]WMJ79275.1 metallophosphoesterase [Clostridium sp. MB40-C1]